MACCKQQFILDNEDAIDVNHVQSRSHGTIIIRIEITYKLHW